MWEKICSGAGDHQVTVDPASMQEETAQQLQQETEAAPQKGKVIPFPQRTGKKERARRRRTLAVACTLVLVVGLSVAYWQLQGPLGQVQGICVRQFAGLHRRVSRVLGSRSDRSGRGYADGGIG